jgi:hypothetical protein
LEIESDDVASEYEKMFGNLSHIENLENLEADFTNFKFALYAVNPYKGKYYGPMCRICGKKSCNGCPLPVFNE